jgi:fumarate reductase subunit D
MRKTATTAKKPYEPFLWLLFSAGGVVAALLIPVSLFLFALAFPLGWLHAPTFESLRELARMPIVRGYLFVLCVFPLFHWAHRFRYTLYDGLQIKNLNELIFVFCYGGAIIGAAVAGWWIFAGL